MNAEKTSGSPPLRSSHLCGLIPLSLFSFVFACGALTNDSPSRAEADALHAIPSLLIVTAPENLFSPETGIYTHPTERGTKWERPASVEFVETNGARAFQINCGVRIHGGMSRRPEESTKHYFR